MEGFGVLVFLIAVVAVGRYYYKSRKKATSKPVAGKVGGAKPPRKTHLK